MKHIAHVSYTLITKNVGKKAVDKDEDPGNGKKNQIGHLLKKSILLMTVISQDGFCLTERLFISKQIILHNINFAEGGCMNIIHSEEYSQPKKKILTCF